MEALTVSVTFLLKTKQSKRQLKVNREECYDLVKLVGWNLGIYYIILYILSVHLKWSMSLKILIKNFTTNIKVDRYFMKYFSVYLPCQQGNNKGNKHK